jgi:hypothetical protein
MRVFIRNEQENVLTLDVLQTITIGAFKIAIFDSGQTIYSPPNLELFCTSTRVLDDEILETVVAKFGRSFVLRERLTNTSSSLR